MERLPVDERDQEGVEFKKTGGRFSFREISGYCTCLVVNFTDRRFTKIIVIVTTIVIVTNQRVVYIMYTATYSMRNAECECQRCRRTKDEDGNDRRILIPAIASLLVDHQSWIYVRDKGMEFRETK
ncbi:hypothetical protein FRC14_008275 [Serendipita sp. 396]|nr:hypothetical protein FRC14_008275 [Serendipita sp. 396]KAG8776044.1 hypothetical protein FRC15_000174 [Serendipita sp. 397]KAG8792538.1 hypothetical protein FRC16_011380 [Serendipita sp. 398]KAG8819693.1 hypothetical protein FRC18_011946 [Serendipita sp. 400]KAG8847093.1 hypothetical protein FRB91_000202 [Serendipita sp. 411]KAG8858213.1 hypothetical protein FRC20_012050 [Serendipita sp. 405]